jgi:hypothetical protein
MSANSASIELISRLVGHTTTATVCRHELPPVITKGTEITGKALAPKTASLGADRRPSVRRGPVPSRYRPSELVGVAGFEPTTSSSRRNPEPPATCVCTL